MFNKLLEFAPKIHKLTVTRKQEIKPTEKRTITPNEKKKNNHEKLSNNKRKSNNLTKRSVTQNHQKITAMIVIKSYQNQIKKREKETKKVKLS